MFRGIALEMLAGSWAGQRPRVAYQARTAS
jgi:hypothetical protein